MSSSETALKGVHHTARPTWKLRETIEFYRDKLGLQMTHAISARAWGPSNHPDFLHFFFDSGHGSTIAFFYYIGADEPDFVRPVDDYRYVASHTAWQVDTAQELAEWSERLASHGIPLIYDKSIRHELLESIYFRDPNGYYLEITRPLRPMNDLDADDAAATMEAAMAVEDAQNAGGDQFVSVDQVWRRKAMALAAEKIAGEAALNVLDVPEFAPLLSAVRADDNCRISGPANGYWRIRSRGPIVFERKPLGLVPAIWYGALSGGFDGEVQVFDRDRLEIVPGRAA